MIDALVGIVTEIAKVVFALEYSLQRVDESYQRLSDLVAAAFSETHNLQVFLESNIHNQPIDTSRYLASSVDVCHMTIAKHLEQWRSFAKNTIDPSSHILAEVQQRVNELHGKYNATTQMVKRKLKNRPPEREDGHRTPVKRTKKQFSTADRYNNKEQKSSQDRQSRFNSRRDLPEAFHTRSSKRKRQEEADDLYERLAKRKRQEDLDAKIAERKRRDAEVVEEQARKKIAERRARVEHLQGEALAFQALEKRAEERILLWSQGKTFHEICSRMVEVIEFGWFENRDKLRDQFKNAKSWKQLQMLVHPDKVHKLPVYLAAQFTVLSKLLTTKKPKD